MMELMKRSLNSSDRAVGEVGNHWSWQILCLFLYFIIQLYDMYAGLVSICKQNSCYWCVSWYKRLLNMIRDSSLGCSRRIWRLLRQSIPPDLFCLCRDTGSSGGGICVCVGVRRLTNRRQRFPSPQLVRTELLESEPQFFYLWSKTKWKARHYRSKGQITGESCCLR